MSFFNFLCDLSVVYCNWRVAADSLFSVEGNRRTVNSYELLIDSLKPRRNYFSISNQLSGHL